MWKKLVLLLIVLAIIAFFAWQALKPAPATRVSVVEPTVQNLRTTIELNAVVVNTQTVTITALLNGEIGEINAREGSVVETGASLASLKNDRAQSVLERAAAKLTYSELALTSAQRGYNRIKRLSDAGNASKQSLDDSLIAVQSADAELSVSKADITLAELDLQNATIVAPFDGVITNLHSEAGQWVEAGTPLFTLAASNGYLIEAQVDASDWEKVSLNQAVYLTTESSPDAKWQSTVEWIAPTIERNDRDAKAVAIRFNFGDDSPTLLLGQEVDAELVLTEVEDVTTLPLSAMVETSPNEYSVFVAKQDKAMLIPVSVGLQNATHAEIVDGLSDQDTVIVSQRTKLEENMPVEVQ